MKCESQSGESKLYAFFFSIANGHLDIEYEWFHWQNLVQNDNISNRESKKRNGHLIESMKSETGEIRYMKTYHNLFTLRCKEYPLNIKSNTFMTYTYKQKKTERDKKKPSHLNVF